MRSEEEKSLRRKVKKKKQINERWEVCKEKDFVKLSALVSVEIILEAGGGGGGGLYNGGAGRVATAAFRMGRRSPLRGWGGTWGCQGAWQVETQRPVTGGEHGSVREDSSEGMEAAEGWGGGLSDEVRRGRVEGEGDMREVNEGGRGEGPEMIRGELSKCERGWLWS